MFTLTAAELGRTLVEDRVRHAEQRRFDPRRAHRVQRERVRASLLLRPEAEPAGRRGL